MKFKLMIGMMIFLIVPFISTISAQAEEFDYTKGLLDSDAGILTNTLPAAVFDNNTTSNARFYNSSPVTVEFAQIADLKAVYTNVYANYPSGGVTLRFFSSDGSLLGELQAGNGARYDNVNYSGVTKIEISRRSTAGANQLNEIDFFGEYVDLQEVKNIENLESVTSDTSAEFSYERGSNNFSYIKIYRNGELIKDKYKSLSFTDENLKEGTDYQYRFVTVGIDGSESDGATKSVKTIVPVPEEVRNLSANAEFDRVDLTWKLPTTKFFEHVNIYRRTTDGDSTAFNLLVPKVHAEETFEPLFETNGTYFNDLSVEPSTKYEYKLTTEYKGDETKGVTVSTTTKGEPKPVMKGEAFAGEEGEPYAITWEEPTNGQVIVSVGGKEIGRVSAGDKSYTIPADKMKYDAFGNPKVSIQPVTDRGTLGDKVGAPTQFEKNLKLPFTVTDLIETGTGLLKMFGPFILVGLAFILVKLIIKLIKDKSLKGKGLQSESPDAGRRIEREKSDSKNVVPSSEKQERESEKQAKLLDKHQQKQQKELRKSQQKEQRQQEKSQRREKSVLRQSERQLARPIRETRQSRESRVSYREPRSQRMPRQGRTGRRER